MDGRVEAIERLVAAGASTKSKDDEEMTPLHYAARQGQVAAIETLVAAGASPHAQAHDNATPLHLAAASTPAWGSN